LSSSFSLERTRKHTFPALELGRPLPVKTTWPTTLRLVRAAKEEQGKDQVAQTDADPVTKNP
jgi:hypothetical protein